MLVEMGGKVRRIYKIYKEKKGQYSIQEQYNLALKTMIVASEAKIILAQYQYATGEFQISKVISNSFGNGTQMVH